MSLNKYQIKELIKETLLEIELFSEDAVKLLLGTIAQESDFGTYLKQLRGGPALSIFQIEPLTHDDHVKNFLKNKPDLSDRIKKACGVSKFDKSYLVFNLKYAICMARVHYLRKPEKLPSSIEGYAKYWKQHYNTYLGKGTVNQFIYNYKKHVL
jgi:hypothetical protein